MNDLILYNNVTPFFKRRKYGTTIFTWLYFELPNGKIVCGGDPWQAITFPKKEIERRFNYLIMHRKEQ